MTRPERTPRSHPQVARPALSRRGLLEPFPEERSDATNSLALSLSKSTPRRWKGKNDRACLIATITLPLSRVRTGTHSVHPVAISVNTIVCTKLPDEDVPECPRNRPRRNRAADHSSPRRCAPAPIGEPPNSFLLGGAGRREPQPGPLPKAVVAGSLSAACRGARHRALAGHAVQALAARQVSTAAAVLNIAAPMPPTTPRALREHRRHSEGCASCCQVSWTRDDGSTRIACLR